MTDLTAAEQAELTRMRTELSECGYRDITRHGQLKVGTRIRHIGHQWGEAFRDGTGVVVALTERPNSSWTRTYGKPDIELIALWDKPSYPGGSRLSGVAQYHVSTIEESL